VDYPIKEFIKEYKLLEQMRNDDISKISADNARLSMSAQLIAAEEFEEAAAFLTISK
jgi:hypothetical protein